MVAEKANLENAELVFIIDRSGSMSGSEEFVMQTFNETIADQKSMGENARVSTVLFDDSSIVVHDRIPIVEVPTLTREDYFVRGATALLDALGAAIRFITMCHKYEKSPVPTKTIFFIITDGHENSSNRYTFKKIQEMIQLRKEKFNWDFLFIGANIDAIAEAAKMGIPKEYAMNFYQDEEGFEHVNKAQKFAARSMRKNEALKNRDWAFASETYLKEKMKQRYSR